MGKQIIVDEYGCEITKEEAEERDRVAHEALNAVYGVKKKPGRPKKIENAEKLHEDSLGQHIEPTKETQGVQSGSSRLIIPIEVMDALEEKMSLYEKTIKSYEEDIARIRQQIKQVEGKYKVLSDFMKGAANENEQGDTAHDTI